MDIKKKSAVLFLVILIVSLAESLHKSDKNQVYYIEAEYTHDWFEALVACARMNMTLLTVDSQEKSEEVNRLVLKTFGKNRILWVGGYAVGPSHQFTWIATGNPFVYSYWITGQPDFYRQLEFCAQIGWGADMRWNDNQCSYKAGYICEYRSKTETKCDNEKEFNKKYASIALQFNNHV